MTKISIDGYPMGRVLYIPTGQYVKVGIKNSYVEWLTEDQCDSLITNLISPSKEHSKWAQIYQKYWLKWNDLPLDHIFTRNDFEIIYD